MMHFNFQALIDFESKVLNREFSYVLGDDVQYLQLSIEENSKKESTMMSPQESSQGQDSHGQSCSSESLTRQSSSGFSPKSKSKRIAKENIRSFRGIDSQDSEDQTPVKRQTRYKKRKGQKQDGYPTKNFLPNFKGPHILFLQSQLGFDFVNQFQIVQSIKRKNGISMKDYELLYKVEAFEETFKKFFRTKVLYRELMLSRSSMKARKVHMKKLQVFEKAFNEKNFQRIN